MDFSIERAHDMCVCVYIYIYIYIYVWELGKQMTLVTKDYIKREYKVEEYLTLRMTS